MSDIAPPRGGVFYGWVVVASTFLVLCVGFGVAYAFNAFFLPLQFWQHAPPRCSPPPPPSPLRPS